MLQRAERCVTVWRGGYGRGEEGRGEEGARHRAAVGAGELEAESAVVPSSVHVAQDVSMARK